MTTQTTIAARDKKILIVDDEEFIRQIVGRFAREMGAADVTFAKTGRGALEHLSSAQTPFDLVISDFNMPETNGLELLKQVRVSAGGIPNDLPFIMLTGIADKAVVGAAIGLDIDAFVTKPVSRDFLKSRISHALEDKRRIHAPDHYQTIDVSFAKKETTSDEPSRRPASTYIPRRPVRGGAVQDKEPGYGMKISLDKVKPGAVLSQDICSPTGDVLLRRGATLSPRLITRIKELAHLDIEIKDVWVEV